MVVAFDINESRELNKVFESRTSQKERLKHIKPKIESFMDKNQRKNSIKKHLKSDTITFTDPTHQTS
jgi:flagellar biosynthesis protein FliP